MVWTADTAGERLQAPSRCPYCGAEEGRAVYVILSHYDGDCELEGVYADPAEAYREYRKLKEDARGIEDESDELWSGGSAGFCCEDGYRVSLVRAAIKFPHDDELDSGRS